MDKIRIGNLNLYDYLYDDEKNPVLMQIVRMSRYRVRLLIFYEDKDWDYCTTDMKEEVFLVNPCKECLDKIKTRDFLPVCECWKK